MPTNTQRILGAAASIGITVAGAWLASMAHTKSASQAENIFANGITATFQNVRNAQGNLAVMVFADRGSFKAFDVDRAVGYAEVPARTGDVTVKFPDLTTGPYAIVAFHDEDENQDLNMDGEWPVEGYATSGALDAHDTPTFRTATIGTDDVMIIMHYAN